MKQKAKWTTRHGKRNRNTLDGRWHETEKFADTTWMRLAQCRDSWIQLLAGPFCSSGFVMAYDNDDNDDI